MTATADRAATTLPLAEHLRRLPPGRRLTRLRTAGQVADDVRDLAARLPVAPGERVGLRLPNGEAWLTAFLALLAAGAAPVLLGADAPDAEARRLLASAGAGRCLEAGDGPQGCALRGDEPGRTGPPGVLLATSGTTGAPILVLRDERSLVAEALRYRGAAGLDGRDRVVLPLPLTHAYALGWLAACVVTGSEVVPLPPTALSAVAAEVAAGATVIALVPTTARLLVLRQRRKRLPAPALRLAMVGAGAVDQRLDDDFRAAFGVSTGRNYGSTETGALFAGLGDLPPLCVGEPMPGVEYRIVGVPGEPGPGVLEVRVDAAAQWHVTTDLAAVDEHGALLVLGRRHGAVRRGGRWVAPAEVESALREHPAVRDAHVRAKRGRFADEDVLVADVVLHPTVPHPTAPDPVALDPTAPAPTAPAPTAPAPTVPDPTAPVPTALDPVATEPAITERDLLGFLAERLSAHKLPERVHQVDRIDRGAVGKVSVAPRRYRFADPAALVEALRAYRRSELVLAMADLGLLDRLAEGADLDDLAGDRLAPGPLRWTLDRAVDLGLLSTTDDSALAPAGFAEQVRLEAELSRTWLGRDAIAAALARGTRPFDTAPLTDPLRAAYSAAMHGPHTARRTRLGLTLLGRRARVLEVSAGPGRYLDALLARDPGAGGHHLRQVGRLAGAPLPAVAAAAATGALTVGDEPPAGVFDACVVSNAAHGPGPGADPAWLLDRLAPGGVLLVDDVFLPDDGGPGAELGLDWLTHGGTAWPRVGDLVAGLAGVGGAVTRTVRLDPPQCCLILAKEET